MPGRPGTERPRVERVFYRIPDLRFRISRPRPAAPLSAPGGVASEYNPLSMWKVGDRLTHRYNPELGAGRVHSLGKRSIEVVFPEAGQILRLAPDDEALIPFRLRAGVRARYETTGETVTLAGRGSEGLRRLEDGRVVPEEELWPLATLDSPLERLARGEVEPVDDFANRLDALHLLEIREADGLGSFLGGRIHLFPHQLYAAERATRSDPVRWLLADEVGLGKTVEACLIMAHLIRARRAERILVVAPDTLTVQWLGELWRKYHQVFVLLDERRLADVSRDLGPDFSPFDAHPQSIVALETLVARPKLAEQAAEAGLDLLVVDEAHHLRRRPGHPGSPAYRAVAPLAASARHALLLTATPLEEDAQGFFRLLQLLRPDELPEGTPFEERLASGAPLPPCTSATRRVDIGGLPPRVPRLVETGDSAHWHALEDLVELMRSREAPSPPARRAKAERIARALAGPAALLPVLARDDAEAREAAQRAAKDDPRVGWLARRVRGWRARGEKTLLFVAHRESLEALKPEIERAGRVRVGVFHEDLSAARRDIEVAQFRLESGPSLLISTECGGEGRNFEFCKRLVLFDLPWNPATVEQRVGRLDRIGRSEPTEIVVFRPPGGLGAALVRLYERLGLLRRPLGGLARELRHVTSAVEEVALAGAGAVPRAVFDEVVREAREAFDRVQEAAYHELHRDPYGSVMAGEILERVPEDLEELTREVILGACESLGLSSEVQRGRDTWSIEFGAEALVDHLPGVAAGSSYLGTFDREEGVEKETIDFFASGHPLVEGILSELAEGRRGQVALLELDAAAGEEPGFGLVALYRRGPGFEARAVDATGRSRPEWARRATSRPLRTRRVAARSWTERPEWSEAIRRLGSCLGREEQPLAVLALRVLPPR